MLLTYNGHTGEGKKHLCRKVVSFAYDIKLPLPPPPLSLSPYNYTIMINDVHVYTTCWQITTYMYIQKWNKHTYFTGYTLKHVLNDTCTWLEMIALLLCEYNINDFFFNDNEGFADYYIITASCSVGLEEWIQGHFFYKWHFRPQKW